MASPAHSDVLSVQWDLVPNESKRVQYFMQNAADCALNDTPISARLISVGLTACAIALSALNAISYFLRIPFRFLTNVVCLDPYQLICDLFVDISSFVRSVIFVSLGVTFIVAGILFPEAIFPHFSSQREETYEHKDLSEQHDLRLKNERLREQVKNLKAQTQEYEGVLRELSKKKG